MKKSLIFIMIVFMLFAIVACKPEVEEPADPTKTEAEGKAALADQGSSGSGKAITPHSGFKIVGTFEAGGNSYKVEVGGKDDLYWVGTYDDADDTTGEYVYFRMKDANTVSIYTGGSWVDFAASSIKDALFGETGLYSALIDNIVYLSFELKSSYGSMFGDLKYAGSEAKNGITCSKYTSTLRIGEEDVATATVYVEPTFAVTVGFDFKLTDSFVKKYGQVAAQAALDAAFSYSADVKFSITNSDIPNYAAISATIVQ